MLDLDGNDTFALNELGSLYFEMGKKEQAYAAFNKAVALEPREARWQFSRGAALFIDGRYQEAIGNLEEALKLGLSDNQTKVALKSIAEANYKLANYGKSIKSYETLANVDSGNPVSLTDLSMFYSNQDDYRAAVNILSIALMIKKPDDAERLRFERGKLLRRASDCVAAIDDFTSIIEHQARAAVLFERGRCYLSLGKADLALKDFTAAEQLNPTFASNYNMAGNAFYMKKDYNFAVSSYTKAIELDGNNSVFRSNRGNALFDKEDYTNAIIDYDTALKIDPDNPDYYEERKNAFLRKGDFDRAIEDQNRLISFKRNNDDLYGALLERGDIFRDARRFSEAARDYSKAIDIRPDDSRAHVKLSQAFESAGKLNQALDERLSLLSANRALYKDHEFQQDLNDLLIRMKRFDKAIDIIGLAIVNEPTYAPYFIIKGTTLRLSGKYSLALQDFSKAISLDPSKAFPFYGRANVFRALGDFAQAKRDYAKANAISPQTAAGLAAACWIDLFTTGLASECDSAIEKRPHDAYINSSTAIRSFKRARYAEAADSFKAALAIEPSLPEAQVGLKLSQARQNSVTTVQTSDFAAASWFGEYLK